jgi:MFS family permease
VTRQPEETRTGTTAEPGTDPRRWRILSVSLVVGFMSLLDVTIVHVALPSVRAGLDASPASAQWLVSGYALAFGLTLVTGGRLGDALGRRRLMAIGLVGFVVASAAVGLATHIGLAVAARLAQGLSAGLLTPQNSGLIQQLFRGPERGRAFGLFGLTVSLSSALGPVIGGAIIAVAGEENGWRWVFLVNVPIGLVALVAVLRLVPGAAPAREEGEVPDTSRGLDVPGALLLGLGVLAVLYPMVMIEGGTTWTLALLPLAPLLLWAFARRELRLARQGGAPLLDVSLLRRTPGYADGILIGTVYFTGFTGIFLVLSVVLQEQLGFSALHTGFLSMPFALGAAVSSAVAGRLVSRYGRALTVVALGTMIAGVVLLVALLPLAVPTMLLAGIGGGAVISPNFTLTLADVPPRMGGAAGAALQTGQRIGSATGAALLMTTYGVVLGRTDDAVRAFQGALVAAVVVLLVAWAAAARSWRRRERGASQASQGSRGSQGSQGPQR